MSRLFIIGLEIHYNNPMMTWWMYAFCSFVLLGLGNFGFRLASLAGQNPIAAILVGYVAQCLLGVAVFLLLKPEINWQWPALLCPMAAGLVIGLSLLSMITAFGKPGAHPGVVVAIMNTNFLLVSLLTWLVLKQPLSIKQLLGFVVILGGMTLVIL